MKNKTKINQKNGNNAQPLIMNSSLRQLVKSILGDCKLDVDAIEESDPEFIGYIADKILEWHVKNCSIPAVINSGENTCPDCGDRGWLYDDDGRRTGICPCHY